MRVPDNVLLAVSRDKLLANYWGDFIEQTKKNPLFMRVPDNVLLAVSRDKLLAICWRFF